MSEPLHEVEQRYEATIRRIEGKLAAVWVEGYERGLDVANGDSDDLVNPYSEASDD